MTSKVCIARLRQGEVYTRPLEHILDSFYASYYRWMKQRDDLIHTTWNFSWQGNTKVTAFRDTNTIREADVIVIPSDCEFRWSGRMFGPLRMNRADEMLAPIKPHFLDKVVVILRSDRGDTEALYRENVFAGAQPRIVHIIDEADFEPNIHCLKYHWLKKYCYEHYSESLPFFTPTAKEGPPFPEKLVDFSYWGNTKEVLVDGRPSGDIRHIILKRIRDDQDLTWQERGSTGMVDNPGKWEYKWDKLIKHIGNGRTTCCWNWIDPEATTSRYPEALALGMVPFVWETYDVRNRYGEVRFQRVRSFKQLKRRILLLRERNHPKIISHIQNNFEEVIDTEEGYYQQFADKMNQIIGG